MCSEDGKCTAKIELAGSPLLVDDLDGDCARPICGGDGDIQHVIDPTDVTSDGLECTIDTCDEGGNTLYEKKPEGTTCTEGGGDLCDGTATCVACALVTAECNAPDVGEPNESQAAANDLGSITDSDGSGETFCAALKGAGDIDWYTYSGTDVAFAEVDPTRGANAQASVRLCAYFECKTGTPSLECLTGDTDLAPGGQQGCCIFPSPSSLNPFTVDFDCVGTGDDDATVWIKVENISNEECVPYKLTYHY
jgi:hypothetical protein